MTFVDIIIILSFKIIAVLSNLLIFFKLRNFDTSTNAGLCIMSDIK
jgi:hypothetical protein